VIEKEANPASISAGDTANYTVTVTNNGAGTAYDVVVIDTLPFDAEWTLTPSAGTCTLPNEQGQVTCDLGDIVADGVVTIEVSAPTTATECGAQENRVTVDASNLTDEPTEPDDRAASATVTVNCPDLVVEKVAGEETINAGDEISFTITVTNNGAGTAYDVVLTDVLPLGITWDVDDEAACEIENGTLTCAWDEIVAGEHESVTISGTTDAGDCGEVTNTATIEASNLTAEPTTEGDRSSTATVTVDCPVVSIDKLAVDSEGNETSTPIGPGDAVSFKIVVENSGDGSAYDVVITDTLPVGIAWTITSVIGSSDAIDTESCAIENGILTCDVGTMPADSTIAVTISGLTPADSCNPIENSATVSSTNWSGQVLLAAETSASAVMPMNCPVEIQKVGPDGESPLAGACFTLTDGEVTFGPECVDENGRARFEMIPVGTYTVTETTTPVGYQPIEEFDIELVYGEIVTVTVINERQPLVVKLDCQVDPGAVDLDRLASDPAYAPEGCERVEGVAFTATANGEPIAGSFITGADGTVRIPAVTGDELVITEDVTTATPGYLPRENPITIDPVPGTGGVAAFVNLPQDGELNLLKVICESDEARQPIFETVDSAGFQVPDGCWRGAGLSFTISGGDLTSPVTITTDRNGEANLTLRFGAYTVTEVSTGASTSITITANVTTYLRVTNFEPETPGVDPTPTPSPTKPIEELPDTGAGFTGGSMLMLILPMLALLLMVAGAMLMTNAKRTRRS
ncbi:MAG: DUF11 domain-containing protein, partial [Thermomicrobiales bacterium]|nr:DUF11 domain-containing protein [Thermomicrobiales bacterium]